MACQVLQPVGATDPFLRRAFPHMVSTLENLKEMTQKELVVKETPDLIKVPQPPPGWLIYLPPNTTVTVTLTQYLVPSKFSRQKRISGDTANIRPPQSDVEVIATAENISLFTQKLGEVLEEEIKTKTALIKKESTGSIIKKLTIFNSRLSELQRVADKIIQFYAARSLGFPLSSDCPTLEEVETVKEKICKIRNIMTLDDLRRLFQSHSIDTTSEHILGSILGLDEEFGTWLHNMDSKCRNHQVDFYHIASYIKDREDILTDENIISLQEVKDVESLAEALKNLGFENERAKSVANDVEEELICLQRPSFWALRYIEHTWLHHPLIGNLPLFPFQHEKVNEWFTQELSQSAEGDEQGQGNTPVRIINLDKKDKEASTALVTEMLNESSSDDCELMFHGTSHKHAVDILRLGISLSIGHREQDFSHGYGFYLSDCYDSAQKWAGSRHGKGGAVMVYKIPKAMLEEHEGLDLNENKSKWETVVRLARSGNGRKLKKELKGFSYVKGPMCSNPRQVSHGGEADGFGASNNQVCIIDDELAEDFGNLSHVCAVMFL